MVNTVKGYLQYATVQLLIVLSIWLAVIYLIFFDWVVTVIVAPLLTHASLRAIRCINDATDVTLD